MADRTDQEVHVKVPKNQKLGGRLMLFAGLAFFVAAALGRQPAFYGVGAAFLAIGLANISKARKRQGDHDQVR
jgi:hypothetical protein